MAIFNDIGYVLSVFHRPRELHATHTDLNEGKRERNRERKKISNLY